MNAALMDPAAADGLLYPLDPAAERDLAYVEAVAVGPPLTRRGPRPVAPYPLAPTIWTERCCPVCRHSYSDNVAVCPRDAFRLDPVLMSQPFLWLG